MKDQPIDRREPARSFRDLVVWRKAHDLVRSVYRQTERFPRREMFGLTSQLRRAAVLVPATIAEGFEKRGPADKTWLPNVTEGSIEEARDYLIVAAGLGYADTADLSEQLEEVAPLLGVYTRAGAARARPQPPAS